LPSIHQIPEIVIGHFRIAISPQRFVPHPSGSLAIAGRIAIQEIGSALLVESIIAGIMLGQHHGVRPTGAMQNMGWRYSRIRRNSNGSGDLVTAIKMGFLRFSRI